jgi:hypothetical protein
VEHGNKQPASKLLKACTHLGLFQEAVGSGIVSLQHRIPGLSICQLILEVRELLFEPQGDNWVAHCSHRVTKRDSMLSPQRGK